MRAGKLPPGAAARLRRELKRWQTSNPGLVSGVRVMAPGPPNDCELAAKLAGITYPLDKPPALPLPGCRREPCCACEYAPALAPEFKPPPRRISLVAWVALALIFTAAAAYVFR